METVEIKNILTVDMINHSELKNIVYHKTDEDTSGWVDFSWHLKKWAENKQHIYELFGNKLTIEKEVEASLPEHIVFEMLNDFKSNFTHKVNEYGIVDYFLTCLSADEIVSNVLDSERSIFGTKFAKGMKVSRVLAKLCPKDTAYSLQTAYSQLLQRFKVRGTAVISIDPKDYITMSENDSNWRSCHALDGEFRAGTLAYMCDKVTAIAYVKVGRDQVRTHSMTGEIEYTITNKVWRQVVYIHKENEYAVQARQYPSTNVNNRNTISAMLVECFNNHHDPLGVDIRYKSEKTRTSDLDDYVVSNVASDYGDRLWYNDITSKSFPNGVLVYPEKISTPEELHQTTTKILVGVRGVKCLCGCSDWLTQSGNLFEENIYNDDYDDEDYDEEEDW